MAQALVAITGNTYPVKDALKAMGARWNATDKAWMVPADKADAARGLVAGKTKTAARVTSRPTARIERASVSLRIGAASVAAIEAAGYTVTSTEWNEETATTGITRRGFEIAGRGARTLASMLGEAAEGGKVGPDRVARIASPERVKRYAELMADYQTTWSRTFFDDNRTEIEGLLA